MSLIDLLKISDKFMCLGSLFGIIFSPLPLLFLNEKTNTNLKNNFAVSIQNNTEKNTNTPITPNISSLNNNLQNLIFTLQTDIQKIKNNSKNQFNITQIENYLNTSIINFLQLNTLKQDDKMEQQFLNQLNNIHYLITEELKTITIEAENKILIQSKFLETKIQQ